ncbi:MAG: hypothetical protein ACI9FJ_002153 [Alteromonadaceae bacterium]|jgi:hypothetical protein
MTEKKFTPLVPGVTALLSATASNEQKTIVTVTKGDHHHE